MSIEDRIKIFDNAVDPEDVVEYLNSVLGNDPVVLSAMLLTRFPCNEVLLSHPTMQVSRTGTGFETSALALINGLFGVLPSGMFRIGAVVDVDQNTPLINRFEEIKE
jgi:hypothetical protein